MSNEIQLHERSTALTAYEPQNIGELRQFAQEVTATALVPQAYRNKPADAMVAMMFGKETAGLGPLTSLQYVAVINGRPAYYSDALPGIAFNKRLVADMEEKLEGEPGKDSWTAVCIVTRPSGTKVTQRFSVADAKRAGLWDKAGPWKQYPQRMLQWRARGWAIRDAAPHLMFGPTFEELRDVEEHQGPDNAREINPQPTAAARRAAMAAVELVEIVTEDGEVQMVLPGEVEQFLRDNPEAHRVGETLHEAEPSPSEPRQAQVAAPGTTTPADHASPAGGQERPARNGNGVKIWLPPGVEEVGTAAEMLPKLAAAIERAADDGELRDLRAYNKDLLARLGGANVAKMNARFAEAEARLDLEKGGKGEFDDLHDLPPAASDDSQPDMLEQAR